MTLISITLGGLFLLAVAVVVIGLFLPESYAGRSQMVYPGTTDDVWEALQDYNKHPMTGKMKKSVAAQPSENDLPVWTEEMRHGELITVKTVAAEQPTHMVREMSSKTVPMTSRWEYTLESTADGCKLIIDGETRIRTGTWHVPIFRLMTVLGGGVKKGLDIQMDMVAATLEVKARRRGPRLPGT